MAWPWPQCDEALKHTGQFPLIRRDEDAGQMAVVQGRTMRSASGVRDLGANVWRKKIHDNHYPGMIHMHTAIARAIAAVLAASRCFVIYRAAYAAHALCRSPRRPRRRRQDGSTGIPAIAVVSCAF